MNTGFGLMGLGLPVVSQPLYCRGAMHVLLVDGSDLVNLFLLFMHTQ